MTQLKYRIGDEEHRSVQALAFLDAYRELCKDHGLCLGHEDVCGSFLVKKYNDYAIRWVLDAMEEVGK